MMRTMSRCLAVALLLVTASSCLDEGLTDPQDTAAQSQAPNENVSQLSQPVSGTVCTLVGPCLVGPGGDKFCSSFAYGSPPERCGPCSPPVRGMPIGVCL
jgi:hypothetical protein